MSEPDIGGMGIQQLFLNSMGLVKLPACVGELADLLLLNLSDNSIGEIGDEFVWPAYLHVLVMAGNQLSAIPRGLKDLQYLKQLLL